MEFTHDALPDEPVPGPDDPWPELGEAVGEPPLAVLPVPGAADGDAVAACDFVPVAAGMLAVAGGILTASLAAGTAITVGWLLECVGGRLFAVGCAAAHPASAAPATRPTAIDSQRRGDPTAARA